MLNAIGSAGFVTPSLAGNSSAGLDPQLAKYKAQLSDWVNCDSCNTPEGKAKIQELSDKIAVIEQKIKAPPQEKLATEARQEALASGTLGSRLNTFA